jgi:two-component sensor histidine kinase
MLDKSPEGQMLSKSAASARFQYLFEHARARVRNLSGVITPWSSKSYSLRTLLIAFGLAIFLPTTILAGLLFRHATSLERAQLESRVVQVAEDLTNDIDRALAQHLTVLKTLAALPSLTAGDWPTFYTQAKAALQGKAYAIVIDSSLRQLVNTRVPFGKAPSVTGDPETARRMLVSKQPAVSNFFFSLIDRTPVFNVDIPILVNGDVRYILIFGQNAADLLPILEGQELPVEWTTAILDRKGVILARSREHQRYVGTAPSSFTADLTAEDESVRRTKNLENKPVLRSSVRSELSGWLITASIPLSIAEEPLRHSAWVWASAAGLTLIATAGLAWLFAEIMAAPMVSAAQAARALGRSETILPLSSSITEANAIVAALKQARDELAQRDDHQQLLLNELTHRVKNVLAVVQAVTMRTLSDQRSIPEVRKVLLDRLYALGRAHELLMRTDWQGASIKDLIMSEVASLSERIELDGPMLTIDGKIVQTLALVLHELSTNAVKHGSLSDENGLISIQWWVTGAGPEARFKFRWKEKHGPAVKPPNRSGFGSTLLKAAIPSNVKPRLVFAPDGFIYELDVPLEAIAPSSLALA